MYRITFLSSVIVAMAMADRIVSTKNGPVRGITVSPGTPEIEAYLGVPFAEPPVGGLRFMKPVPKGSWKDTYDASRIAPTCYQNASNNFYEPNTDNMTEDCLYLNLWVPYSIENQLKPIMLLVHGGAFNIGSSNMPTYDGTNLARYGDVIVATVNYRVGALGFFLAFIEEADGNMGIYDQILAMKWIKDNAESFGGDPERLVLMGQSAGGYITAAHLISPLTKNLFKRTIVESGAFMYTINLDDNERLYLNSQAFATKVGCANKTMSLHSNPQLVVECLKRLPAQELADVEGLMKIGNPVSFFPRTGDAYMPISPVQFLKEGNFMDAEMLIGMNEAEGTFFLTVGAPQYFGVNGVNRTDYLPKRVASYLLRIFFHFLGQKNEKEVAEQYISSIQSGTADTYTDSMAMAIGDFLINCGTFFHAEYHSLRNPVYFYLFQHRLSSEEVPKWLKATHAFELPYVFGNPFFENFTSEESVVSNRVMARWAAFAKTGIPDVPGLVEWPKYTHEHPVYLDINDEERIVHSRPENSRCEFWRDRFQADIDSSVISKIKG